MPSNWERPLEVTIKLSVKTYDIDFGTVVSNLVYIRWLEDLRLRIMDTYCPLEDQLAKDIAPVLLQTQIEYKRAIKFAEKPIGRMWAINMSKHQWIVKAEISVDDKIAAIAEQKGLFVRLSDGYPTSVPDQLYQEYLRCQNLVDKVQVS